MVATPATLEQSLTSRLAVDRTTGQAARQRAGRPGNAVMLFAGGMIGLALAKEILRRLGEQPVIVQAKQISHTEEALSLAVLVRVLQQIGVRALGYRPPV
jgi:hypothetical protein